MRVRTLIIGAIVGAILAGSAVAIAAPAKPPTTTTTTTAPPSNGYEVVTQTVAVDVHLTGEAQPFDMSCPSGKVLTGGTAVVLGPNGEPPGTSFVGSEIVNNGTTYRAWLVESYAGLRPDQGIISATCITP
jgi:hypothetical protein